MLKVWTAEQQSEWDKIIPAHASDGGLLQSWAWGRFQEQLGNAVYNVSDEAGQYFAQCLQLKAGNQWVMVIPRGPVAVKAVEADTLSAFLRELKAFARERGCFLLRLDPAWEVKMGEMLMKAGASKAKRERNPKQTLIIDTKHDEDQLFGAMKSKWRYNVRLAEKKEVTVRLSDDPSDAKLFWQLVEKTTDRQGFASYDESYFQALMSALGPSKQAAFLIAESNGQPIAALLLGFSGSMATYLHGASDYEHRHLMAPHLLQWHGILEAKKRGMAYDFWGVSEKDWPGVTRFKQGFAPTKAFTDYVGTYEMPVKRGVYALYRLRSLFK